MVESEKRRFPPGYRLWRLDDVDDEDEDDLELYDVVGGGGSFHHLDSHRRYHSDDGPSAGDNCEFSGEEELVHDEGLELGCCVSVWR
jgi:hypothetical protein